MTLKSKPGFLWIITARDLLGFRNFDPLSGLTSKGDIALILALLVYESYSLPYPVSALPVVLLSWWIGTGLVGG
jgi:hypothetical protein